MTEHGKTRRVGVVMAGGSGERFWPISRRLRPKQLLHLTQDQETMLGEAVSRVAPLIAPEDVYVVTGEHLVAAIREAGVGVPDENVIAEPCKRNTAGCLAYAAAHLLAKYGGDGDDLTMAVLTADHIIGDSEAFRATIRIAMDAAESEQALATVGMVPTRPETGYGYIQADADPLPQYAGSVQVYPVAAFHEKPDAARAEAFMQSGHYFWNGGMFFWRLSVFLAALAEASPNIAAAVRAMTDAMRAGDDGRVRQAFEALENISIDYALMERADNVVVARADFDWDDVGSWPALDGRHRLPGLDRLQRRRRCHGGQRGGDEGRGRHRHPGRRTGHPERPGARRPRRRCRTKAPECPAGLTEHDWHLVTSVLRGW